MRGVGALRRSGRALFAHRLHTSRLVSSGLESAARLSATCSAVTDGAGGSCTVTPTENVCGDEGVCGEGGGRTGGGESGGRTGGGGGGGVGGGGEAGGEDGGTEGGNSGGGKGDGASGGVGGSRGAPSGSVGASEKSLNEQFDEGGAAVLAKCSSPTRLGEEEREKELSSVQPDAGGAALSSALHSASKVPLTRRDRRNQVQPPWASASARLQSTAEYGYPPETPSAPAMVVWYEAK